MSKTIFWFRRDLRLHDNHGLFRALQDAGDVQPVFIFDKHILDGLPTQDGRVTFIHDALSGIQESLRERGAELLVYFGEPVDIWQVIIQAHQPSAVYCNHDYEPYARTRDKEVGELLAAHGASFHTYKDHVLFEEKEILTGVGGVYTVFTPYKRKWLEHFQEHYLAVAKRGRSFYPSEDCLDALHLGPPQDMIALTAMGFERSTLAIPSTTVPRKVIKAYAERRDFPALPDSTSRLGIHFRFGTISIREKALAAEQLSAVYLSELIWRDFYAQILANFPHVVEGAFRPQYDMIEWRESPEDLKAWQEGRTGYPMVDAGMRELNATGYMHNRVRMITASFLTKHLLINWRYGEAYFAEKLLDFDLASNNGGWQWASGSGTDAAPYFRIFNPESQMKKFDPQLVYIKKWVPEFGTDQYVDPIVDHKFARERCLATYKAVLANK